MICTLLGAVRGKVPGYLCKVLRKRLLCCTARLTSLVPTQWLIFQFKGPSQEFSKIDVVREKKEV